MKMSWKNLIVIGLVAGLTLASARMGGAEPLHLTLRQVVTEVLESSPRLRAQAHRVSAAARDSEAVARSRYGELNAVASYAYLNDDQILRPMARELVAGGLASLPFDRSQAHYGVTYEVPLYLGGRLTDQIRVADLEARKARSLQEGTRWQVRFNAVSLYAAAQALDRVAEALDGQIVALEQTNTNLEAAVAAGKRPELDRLKLLDELASTRAQSAKVAADRARVGALLLAVLGRDPAGAITVDPLPETVPALPLEPDQLRAMAGGTSAVHVAQLEQQQAEQAAKMARSAFLPRVVGNANYLEHTGFNLDRSLETWSVSVGLVFPLFSGTADVHRVRATRERHAAAEQAVVQAQLNVAAELQETLARLQAHQAALAAAETRVTAAAAAARIEQVRYDTGAGTIEELLRARAREAAAQAALATAKSELRTTGERLNSIAEKEIIK